jgi:uncharacterized protein YjaG (DUF416 family)
MATFSYSKIAVQQRLEPLPDRMRVAFGLSCCERMFPNYLACKKKIKWGDERPLRLAMDALWEWIGGKRFTEPNIKKFMNECEVVAPNSEDFSEVLTTPAQDACFAVCCVLEYLLTQNLDRIVQASTYSIDTLDLWVQEIQSGFSRIPTIVPNSPEREERIRLYPLMQRELARQDADLKLLATNPDVGSLKIQWSAPSKSNIDL